MGDFQIKQPKLTTSSMVSPHGSSNTPSNSLRPIFSLQHMAMHAKDHCLDTCQKDEKVGFANTLNKLSRMTWAEIKQAHRHGAGYEKIPTLDVPIHASIPQNTPIIAFRFHGLKPMIGYREDNIFHILFLDHKMKCYKH